MRIDRLQPRRRASVPNCRRRFSAVASTALFELTPLESRLLLSAVPVIDLAIPPAPDILPPVNLPASSSSSSSTSASTSPGQGVPATAADVPALSSDPGATAKLYLNFAGLTVPTWGAYSPGTVPAYDTNGDPTTFIATELANIQLIWQRVAEVYSPFNLDVTTVDPGSLDHGRVMEVVIGGNGSWLGALAGGVCYVGSFVNTAPNIAFVFPDNLGRGNPKYTADAAAHEAGHGFGLEHQSTWSGGNLVQEYNTGTSAVAPIMGNPYYSTRATWWYGTNDVSSNTMQNDISIIGGAANGFGFRDDSTGNSVSSAIPLSVSGNSVSASGVIVQPRDSDYFSFTTSGGAVTLSGNVASVGPTLDLKLQLIAANGSVVATADSTSSLSQTISTHLTAGTYYLVVGSHGAAGDLGTYTVSGTIVPGSGDNNNNNNNNNTGAPDAPQDLAASSLGGRRMQLSWTTTFTNETYFEIQRRTDNYGWRRVGRAQAGSTSFVDRWASVGIMNYYRIRAINSAGPSAYSNVTGTRAKLRSSIRGRVKRFSPVSLAVATSPTVFSSTPIPAFQAADNRGFFD